MIRLLPFRQVNESDIINMFALEGTYVNSSITGVGSGDAGVFVKVSSGNLNLDPVAYTADSYLGNTAYPHIGSTDLYPKVNKTVVPTTSGDVPLGLTLLQTARTDENGEKLLYYPQKAKEMQTVLPGQAVPIATRGLFMISTNAFDGTVSDYAIGTGLSVSDYNGGTVSGVAPESAAAIGTVLGTGVRSPKAGVNDLFSGEYMLIKLGK